MSFPDNATTGTASPASVLANHALGHQQPRPVWRQQCDVDLVPAAMDLTDVCDCPPGYCTPGIEGSHSKSIESTYAEASVHIPAPGEKEVMMTSGSLQEKATLMSVSALPTPDNQARRKAEHSKTEAGRRKEESKRREKIANLLPGIFLINAEPGNRKKGAANYTKIGVLDGVIKFIESLPADARARAEEKVGRRAEEIKKKDPEY